MSRLRVSWMQAAGLVVAVACTPHSLPRTDSTRTSLRVENNTTFDVRIFLVAGASETRLGTVTGMSTAVYRLAPSQFDRDIRVAARPVGGWRQTLTDPIAVRAGQQVALQLDNMLRSYRLSVW